MVENLTVLLGDEFQFKKAAVFPCEKEIPVVETLIRSKESMDQADFVFPPNQSLAIIWDAGQQKMVYWGLP